MEEGTGHLSFLKNLCHLKFPSQFFMLFLKPCAFNRFVSWCFRMFFAWRFSPKVPVFHPPVPGFGGVSSKIFVHRNFQGSKDKPSTKRVLGNTPAPTTTQSAGKTSPSSNSTPFTASFPRNKRTWEVPNHSTPAQQIGE